jgi:hypothetical protein
MSAPLAELLGRSLATRRRTVFYNDVDSTHFTIVLALAFNNSAGGFSEYELRSATSDEREKQGIAYEAGAEYKYPGSLLQSAGAYSPDGETLLFFDTYFPTGRADYRSSYVTVPHANPWGGAVAETEGYDIRHLGYGPKHVVFSRADYTGDRLTLRKVWHICHGRDVLTQTSGLFPTYVRSDDMVYFVAIGADDTLLRIDVYGNQETAVHQFVGAHVRSLAVTRDRHASRFDFDPSSDELLVSVYFPAQRKSTIFACYHSSTGFHVHPRFDVPADWVCVAGTGILGGGTRIVYNLGENLLIWDNRDGKSYQIFRWVDNVNPPGLIATPLGPFRQSALGSGIAISTDVRV